MDLDEFTQPGWVDAADNFREGDKKYGTADLSVPVIVKPQTDDDASAPPPLTFGELMEMVDIAPGISPMPQGTPRPGSSHLRLGSVNPQSKTTISGDEPAVEPNTSLLLRLKPVEPGRFYPCI
jgi:hypothetical protein